MNQSLSNNAFLLKKINIEHIKTLLKNLKLGLYWFR